MTLCADLKESEVHSDGRKGAGNAEESRKDAAGTEVRRKDAGGTKESRKDTGRMLGIQSCSEPWRKKTASC